MTTCPNYMQHIMKLSKSPKRPEHVNTCRSQAIEHKPQKRGGGSEAAAPPFIVDIPLVDFCRCLGRGPGEYIFISLHLGAKCLGVLHVSLNYTRYIGIDRKVITFYLGFLE